MSNSAPGKEGFHPLSAGKAGAELPLHDTAEEPLDRVSAPRTPVVEVPDESPNMPVLTPQLLGPGSSPQQPSPIYRKLISDVSRPDVAQFEQVSDPATRKFTILLLMDFLSIFVEHIRVMMSSRLIGCRMSFTAPA